MPPTCNFLPIRMSAIFFIKLRNTDSSLNYSLELHLQEIIQHQVIQTKRRIFSVLNYLTL